MSIAVNANSVDATSILHEIKQVGAKRVVEKYYDTNIWEHIIMPGIRRAEPAWLNVAEQLHKGSDGGASEDLDDAIFDALAAAPFRALHVIERMYGRTPEDICNMTFESEVPKGGVAAYLGHIERGLANPKTKQEIAMAKACRQGLAKTRIYAKTNGLK